MSVWSEIGIIDGGTFFGVLPGAFLQTAWGFLSEIKNRLWPWMYQMSAHDFSGWQKSWPIPDWQYDYFERSFRVIDSYVTFGAPVSPAVLSGSPDWNAVFTATEGGLLGQTVIPFPYYMRKISVMAPGWYKQRYALYQLFRYTVVPLDITLRHYYNNTRTDVETDHVASSYFVWGTEESHGGSDWYDKIDVSFPAYWSQATTCKIGIEGEAGKPLGISWVDGKTWSYQYTGAEPTSQTLTIYGAVDLTTHPDFSQYFDIDES